MSATITRLDRGFSGSGFLPANQATCDAGNCDAMTRALIWDDALDRWLSMCAACATRELGPAN
jgi:hypothetical protein